MNEIRDVENKRLRRGKQNKKNEKKKRVDSVRVGSKEEMKGLYGWGRENREDERIRKDGRESIWANSYRICEKWIYGKWVIKRVYL